MGTELGRHNRFSRLRAPQKQLLNTGQSTTLLPDGNYLLLGGVGNDGKSNTSASIRNVKTGTVTSLATGLSRARAWHSATVLPNGQVLIFGGVGSNGRLVSVAELFDPARQSFSPLTNFALQPRARHTATLLTDGTLFVAGGVGEDESPVIRLDQWDFRNGSVHNISSLLLTPREDHIATLLSDGTVLLSGGANNFEGLLKMGELFDPARETTQLIDLAVPNPKNTDIPQLAASIPAEGEKQVALNSLVAIRFTKQLEVLTINAQTVSLTGPEGTVLGTAIPAEQGMLAFFIPASPLSLDTEYHLNLDGVADANGFVLAPQVITFHTIGESSGPGTVIPITPIIVGSGPANNGGVPTPPAMPPLRAAPGITALSGRVLQLNGMPLPHVILQVGNSKTYTDATGRFLLQNLTPGHQVLIIDGEASGRSGEFYGIFEVGVDVAAEKTNSLDYIIWMTELEKKNEVKIPSPTVGELVVSTPSQPGLELHLAPKTTLRDLHGNVVTQLGITMIPVKQPPFPLPMGVRVPIYFTIQPGGAYIDNGGAKWSKGAQLYYPNLHHASPGTEFDFWNYDPTGKGWYRYGTGKVGKDGKQIIPDPGVEIYEFTGAMVASPGFGPTVAPPCPSAESCPAQDSATGGEPVNLKTGLFVYTKTDLTVSDVVPIVVSRTYRQMDGAVRSFGIGTSDPYDIFLTSYTACAGFERTGCYSDMELFMPDGSQILYNRISPGISWTDAILQASSTPTKFFGSLITWNGSGWSLKLKDGTIYKFPESDKATVAQQAALISITDRYGNKISIGRQTSNGALTEIDSPNNRWIKFTSNASGCITQATDNIGRTVGYVYDGSNYLVQVTDANGGVTKYGYGTVGMQSIIDPRGISYLTNEFDSKNKVIRQTQGDGSIYTFNYILDTSGNVSETDVIDPLGRTKKITFNANGYPTTATLAAGLPEQQTTTMSWDTSTNLLQYSIDQAGNETSYTYDSLGNTLTLTTMTGTTGAATTTYTYEPSFNNISAIIDPLLDKTSFSYDSNGNLTSIIDALGQITSMTYNSAGQLLTITDPLQNPPIQFNYDSGDVVAVTDPLGRSLTVFHDGVGRTISTADALGETTRFTLDSLDEAIQSIDAKGGITQYSYDGNGNMTSLTDALGHGTKYSYDNMDRRILRADPLGAIETVSYDQNGNISGAVDRRGKNTAIQYDGLNRPVFFGYGGPTYESTVSFTFDNMNRITKAVDSIAGTITRSYDEIARTKVETTLSGTVATAYDAVGRRTSMTVGGQPVVNYLYDSANRVTQISQNGSTVKLSYDADDRRQSVTLPNGIVITYGYNSASQLTSLGYVLGASTIGSMNYGYDLIGRRITMSGSLAFTNLPLPVNQTTYDANNRLTQWGQINLAYDANGNVTGSGAEGYNWDARNRLTSTLSGAGFAYDPFGRRTQMTLSGTTTNFLYDGPNAVQQLQGASPSANMLMGGIDEVFQRTDAAGVRDFLTDALGSTIALTDPAGVMQTQYVYDAFGNTVNSGSTTTNNVAFSGREIDPTGLYFSRARYYNPQLQRFISEDPIGFSGGDNFYRYADDNPISYKDPFGLDVTINLQTGAGGAGHIGIGVNTKQTDGFYPLHETVLVPTSAGAIPVDPYYFAPIASTGVVLKDNLHDVVDSITLHTTPEQDRKIQKFIDARRANPGLYNLFGRNCVGFVHDALAAGGIQTELTLFPSDLFYPLKYPGINQFPIH
jgi:RHS repeat-associated protein